MRLASLQEFRRLFYTPDSAPAMSTLRARVDRGEIPGGRKEGSRYYVDLDEYERKTQFSASVRAKLRDLSSNPLLDGLV